MQQRGECHLDMEFTALGPLGEIWEIGAVVRDPGKADVEHHIFVEDVDLAAANLDSLNIGGFYQRHPVYAGRPVSGGTRLLPGEQAATELEKLTRDRMIIGDVPDADAQCGRSLLWRNGKFWAAHYQLIDVVVECAGFLKGIRRTAHSSADWPTGVMPDDIAQLLTPPYDFDELCGVLGMPPRDPSGRHTALGDARRVRDAWVALGSSAS